ncbi:hypothetical protein TELCIR_17369, partial [Teladorsagia circumcincta]
SCLSSPGRASTLGAITSVLCGIPLLFANTAAFAQGEEYLTTYTFNTHRAKHKFCSICGVQSFYVPRSNPDSI